MGNVEHEKTFGNYKNICYLDYADGFMGVYTCQKASQVALVVKNLAASAGYVRDMSLISGLERAPGGGHGNPLQCSCLENPIQEILEYRILNTGAWWATVHSVAKSWTRVKQVSIYTHTCQSF